MHCCCANRLCVLNFNTTGHLPFFLIWRRLISFLYSSGFAMLNCGKLSIARFVDNAKNALLWHPPVDSNYAQLVISQPSTQSSEGMHPRLSEVSFAKSDNFILVRSLVPCHYFIVNKV